MVSLLAARTDSAGPLSSLDAGILVFVRTRLSTRSPVLLQKTCQCWLTICFPCMNVGQKKKSCTALTPFDKNMSFNTAFFAPTSKVCPRSSQEIQSLIITAVSKVCYSLIKHKMIVVSWTCDLLLLVDILSF